MHIRAIAAGWMLLALATAPLRAQSLSDPPAPPRPPAIVLEVVEAPPLDSAEPALGPSGEPWIESTPGWTPQTEGAGGALGPKDRWFADELQPTVEWPSESWLGRPFSLGWFGGGLVLDDIMPGEVEGGTGFFTGVRLGWDFAPTAGVETRLATSKVGLDYPLEPLRVGDAELWMWDVNWVFYPWANEQWRPFVNVGLGFTDIRFLDTPLRESQEFLVGIPFGIGVKYRVTSRLAMRAELQDNLAIGAGQVDTLNNFSFTSGFEWRFGSGPRRSYYPWNPSRSWW